MKILVTVGKSNVQIYIVDDYFSNEYRLFFVSVGQEEAFFENPGKP